MTRASTTVELRCSRCNAPLSLGIEGMCSACLLRLAMVEEPVPAEAIENLPRLDAALGVTGQRIGNYELLAEISRGGMGIVYRARQVNAGRVVALKVMLPQLLPIAGMRERFRREIEAVARLDHPGILPIYEVDEHAGLPLFSMKLAERGSLGERIASLRGRWREIAALMSHLAHAVEHAHDRGILHRDLKPANILFDAQDAPLVADFGLAKFRVAEAGLTIPATALGSPNYMAPEQISAEFGDVGPATDVYGLGAILYELLAGRPPLVGADAIETLRRVSSQQPQPAANFVADVPADLDAIALKCLAKHPSRRYASARDVALDLERWIATGSAQAARERRGRRVRRWSAAAVAALAVAGAAVVIWRPAVAPALASMPRTLAVMPFREVNSSEASGTAAIVRDGLLRELRHIESLNIVADDPGTRPGSEANEQVMSPLMTELQLDGDVHRSGDSIRVVVRIEERPAKILLWEGEVTRPLDAATQIPELLAESIGAQLRSDSREIAWADFQSGGAHQDSQAYNDYLRARALIRWRQPQTLREAVRLLRAALARDPNFAAAHSALAYAYARWPPPSPPEGDHWTLAVQFARSALALDPSLGEPHAVLGHYYTDRAQSMEAEPHLRKAMEANPRDPTTLHFNAMHLNSVGKLREALRSEQRSVALDGSTPETITWLAKLTARSGDRAEALRLWQRADSLGTPHTLCAAVARLDLGQSEPLAQYYREVFDEDASTLLAGVLDASRRGPALAWLRAAEPRIDPAFAITHYAMLGDTDAAFRIASTYDLRDDFWYLYQIVNIWASRTESLRHDPRFGSLLSRWGLIDYWRRYGPSELCRLTESGAICD